MDAWMDGWTDKWIGEQRDRERRQDTRGLSWRQSLREDAGGRGVGKERQNAEPE